MFKTTGGCFFLAFFASFINIVELMLYYKKFVLKAIRKQMKWVFSIVLLMLHYKKGVFKANRNLLFILLSYFCNIKNVFKTSGKLLLVYAATFAIWKKCGGGGTFLIQKIGVQNKGGLVFSLSSYFYNMKNVCLKKQGLLLSLLSYVYLSTFVIQKHVCWNQGEVCCLFYCLFTYFCNSETCVFKSSRRLLFF